MAYSLLYQPSPRFNHCAAQVGKKAYLWGGRTQNLSLSSRQTLASEIEMFDVFSETWKTRTATGAPPPGLFGGACTVVSETLYHFGGLDGHSWYNTLHCLDTLSLDWRELHGHAQSPANQPMPKIGCGLVAYTDTASLAVFAGYGIPRHPTQTGSRFLQDTDYSDGSGWTNEFHLFNLTNGEWSSPPTTGPRPPPCCDFSFTAINHHMAVLFGGYHCGQGGRGRVNYIYIIDFRSMEWTKLKRPEGAPWPAERTDHAACCFNYGDDLPQLLVTGGVDKKGKTLSDAWLLDINTGRWRELTLPEGTQPRWGHTVTSFRLDEGRVHATTFGGCPEYDPNRSEDDDPKLADTTVMEFESMKSLPSDGTRTSEWVLVSVTGSSGLGTPERLKKLENVKQRRTEHESPLPRRASQTADTKPKVKQLSPKEKKPSLPDIKPKIEMLPKKELGGFKIEPKEEVEEDVKLKQVFSVSDVEKGDLVEELAAKHKLLEMISQLKEQIAEKDNEINERDNHIAEMIDEMDKQIAEKDQQIAEKDKQVAKLAEQIAEKGEQIAERDQQILEQAKQIAELAKLIAEKDEQTVKYQQMYEGLVQESQVHRKQPSEQPVLTHGGMRTDVTTTEYLRGFETFAKTSFVIDSHSQTFEWQRYGLKLHIPEGSVRAEHTECRVDIKAGFTGQFNIPDDLQLVSCVYWLSCPQKFVKPVTLEIEHCASLQDSSQSSTAQFIVAKCSQAELPYQFRVLEKGTFLPKSSYGSIQVSQFSFFGISIPKRSQSLQRYCCTHHYIQKDVNQWDVDFIITTGLEASLTAIQERYSDLDIISGPDFEVQFKEDIISLEIPEDGLQSNGWEIRPLVPPAITKQQVDTFNPGRQGQRIPYCRLQVKLKVKTLVELEYKVGLRGAKSPFDFFTITCPPKEHVGRQARVTGGKRKQVEDNEHGGILKKRHLGNAAEMPTLVTGADGLISSMRGVLKKDYISRNPTSEITVMSSVQEEAETIGIDTLADITSYLHPLEKTAIFNLGLVLGLDYNRLKPLMDTPSFLQDMLAGWLQAVDHVLRTGAPTWKRLVEALEDPRVGQTGLASKIEKDKL